MWQKMEVMYFLIHCLVEWTLKVCVVGFCLFVAIPHDTTVNFLVHAFLCPVNGFLWGYTLN